MKRWLALIALVLGACAQAQDGTGTAYPAPIQALTAKGIAIKGKLPAPDGYQGYAGEYRGRAVPIYLLPDGQHTMIGTLFDATGNDLTQAPLQAASAPKLDAATWTVLEKSSWIAEGAKDPSRIVYVITDTECPYCHKLWQAYQPLLAGSGVQVRHILVAVIAPQSRGRAAAVLDAADPAATLLSHERDFGHSPVKPEQTVSAATGRRIDDNIALMDQLGVTGTPATFYKDRDGTIRRADGLMGDALLKVIFGR